MTTGETFPFALCIIPTVLLATVAGLFLLTRYFQDQAQGELGTLRSAWRQFHTARQDVEQIALDYLDEDAEPFRSHALALQDALVELDEQAQRLGERRVALNQQAADLKLNFWRTMLGAPYLWYLLRRDAVRLLQDLEQAGGALAEARQMGDDLGRMSWKVAQQARQALQVQQQVSRVMARLHDLHLQGDTMEAAERQAGQARQALAGIPALYLEAGEATVLAQAGKEGVAGVYQVLQETRPALDQLFAQAQAWEGQYQQASDKVSMLRRVLDDLQHTLDNLPAGLEASEARQQFDQLAQIASSLEATLARIEVESMSLVAEEAGRMAQAGQETASQLKRARRELAALDVLLQELPAGFKDLSLRLATLGAKSTHPVAWSRSTDQLSALNRQANALGKVSGRSARRRTPDGISQDLETAGRISAQQKELARHIARVEQAHTDLLNLLAGPQLSRLAEWMPTARRLGETVQAYAAENWSRADAVASLLDEIEALDETAQELVIREPGKPIGEDQVAARLEEVTRLAEAYQKLQKRVEHVQARLADLQQSETAAQAQLEEAQAVLRQIEFTVNSNEFLSSIAAQELSSQVKELAARSSELAQRQSGNVEKKTRQAAALAARIEQSANHWLDQLNEDIEELVEQLSAVLKALDDIAPLEEPAVNEARRLLASGQTFNAGAYPGKARFRLAELPAEFKRRSDCWQACFARLNGLEDVRPLLDTFEQANFNRGKARKSLSEATTQMRQKQAWPPSTVSLDAERQEMQALEEQWQALGERPARAIPLAAQLANLSARYQTLTEKIGLTAGRAAQEQTEVGALEVEINNMAQLWQNLLYEHHANPEASQEIQELLDAVNRELAQVRRKYIQGNFDYDQALQAMRNLHKKVRYYQVALDEQSAVDISGKVSRKKESRRI
jgi:chromosome segregation ATPase